MGQYLAEDKSIWQDDELGIVVKGGNYSVSYLRDLGIVLYTDDLGKRIELSLYVVENLKNAAATLQDVSWFHEGKGLFDAED